MAELCTGGVGRMAGRAPEKRPARKPLRKGTQSCTECRRRKIRCTFPPDNPYLCIPCSARGSQCVDQRALDSTPDEKGTLRERVARLESLLEGLLKNNEDGTASIENSRHSDSADDTFEDAETTSYIDRNITDAPLMSALNDAIGNEDVESQYWVHNDNPNEAQKGPYSLATSNTLAKGPCAPKSRGASNDSTSKSKLICEKLRSSLPKYDDMMAVFAKEGSWWAYWRQKTYGEAKPTETLLQYTSRIYTSEVPMDLGLLVCAFGLSADQNGSLYLALVDRLVISDDEYAATLTGLECIVLQGKCYLDIGQPRRAWLAYRRGLVLGQLMNLHRNHRDSVEADNLWWALYQGDRFMSILLGLPYSVNDAHLDLGVRETTDRMGMPLQPFAVRCGVVAGKLIDRNQSATEPNIIKTMVLDAELQAIAASMPQSWWDISTLLVDPSIEVTELRLRLLLHVFFHLIRMYVHLPFLFKLQQDHSGVYEQSRAACIDSARLMVQRYHMLRSDFQGQCLYECKCNDFVGFTASVVLLVGTARGRTSSAAGQSTMQELDDWTLIEESLAIFERLNKRSPCKLFSQSHRALFVLMGKQDLDSAGSSSSSTIFIPYFGKVSPPHDSVSISASWSTSLHQAVGSRAAATPESLDNVDNTQGSPAPNTSASSYENFMPDAGNVWGFEPVSTLRDNFSLPASSSLFGGNVFPTDAEYFGGYPGDGDPFTWLNDNVPMMDIDQDWSWMEQ